jgi:hypothetical protein
MPKFKIVKPVPLPSEASEEPIQLSITEITHSPPRPPLTRPIELPASFKPHPQYTSFFACEETGKIMWKKGNEKCKEKRANIKGYIQLSQNGQIIANIKQQQFIADIFAPPPPRTTAKMESRYEKWELVISDEYKPSEHNGFLPPRFLKWTVVEESRRETAARKSSSRSVSPKLTVMEKITKKVLRDLKTASGGFNSSEASKCISESVVPVPANKKIIVADADADADADDDADDDDYQSDSGSECSTCVWLRGELNKTEEDYRMEKKQRVRLTKEVSKLQKQIETMLSSPYAKEIMALCNATLPYADIYQP